ncbi:hypothetical protein FACS1894201_03970 [Bacteroidia bacterium]|nr:hypothetical protein FACS1894201_03970 [Bacteroidia bacterium]
MIRQTTIGLLLLICAIHASIATSQITLTLTNRNNGHVQIAYTTPSHCNNVVHTVLYKIDFDSVWHELIQHTPAAGTTNYTLTDEHHYCNTTVAYRVAVANDVCTSAETSVLIQDKEPPDEVPIDALSVDTQSGHLFIQWTPLFSGCSVCSDSISGYKLFQQIGATVTAFNTLHGGSTASYLIPEQPNTSVSYRIAAVDNCGNTGLMSEPKKPFMATSTYEECQHAIRVQWTTAQQSIKDIDHFEIWVSEADSIFTKKLTVDNTLNTASFTANHTDGKVQVFVRAVSAVDTLFANSTIATIYLQQAPTPSYHCIKNVTYTKDGKWRLTVKVDKSVTWQTLSVYANDTIVDQLAYGQITEPYDIDLDFSDIAIHTEVQNACGFTVSSSDTVRGVSLHSVWVNTQELSLRWNAYQGRTIQHYAIYRVSGKNDRDTLLLATLPAISATTYAWSDTSFTNTKSSYPQWSYFVRAISDLETDCEATLSQSNRVIVYFSAETPIYLPTGFYPDGGLSPLYRPLYAPLSDDDLQWFIIDRWGKTVFEAHTYEQAWDGTYLGQPLPGGVYVCSVILVRLGITTRKQVAVTLLR